MYTCLVRSSIEFLGPLFITCTVIPVTSFFFILVGDLLSFREIAEYSWILGCLYRELNKYGNRPSFSSHTIKCLTILCLEETDGWMTIKFGAKLCKDNTHLHSPLVAY